MKKKLIEVLGIVAAFSLCVGVINQGSTVVEAQVSQNLEKILEVDSDVLTSSNPFDYTENKYYENIVNQGMDAAVIFVVMGNAATQFAPNITTDPVFAANLRLAQKQGVEVYVYTCEVNLNGVRYTERIPMQEESEWKFMH